MSLRRLCLPLIRPYRLSYRTFDEFEPYLVEVVDDSGRTGFADGHISPGSSAETREGGWAFMRERIPEMLGRDPAAAKAGVLKHFEDSKVATTALACAVEVLEGNPLLNCDKDTTLPLLTPYLIAAFSLSIALSMGELGATVMVYPPGWVTLPVGIFALSDRGAIFDAAALTMVLAFSTLIVLLGLARIPTKASVR